jgi:hypothetical protein
MPVESFVDWLKGRPNFTGFDVHGWLTSPTIRKALALFDNEDEAVSDYQYDYSEARRALGNSLALRDQNRQEQVLSACEGLTWILDAGLEAVALAEKIAASKDAKWSQRVALDLDPPDPKVFYRKMSSAEYESCTKDKGFRFKATFSYMGTELYRYWMSSSLKKVEAFGNENKTDDGDIIVKFTFSHGLADAFESKLRPHQLKGVQGDRTLVAFHREGFAQRGNLTDKDEMKELIQGNKNFNLGFTQTYCAQLQALLTDHEVVKT